MSLSHPFNNKQLRSAHPSRHPSSTSQSQATSGAQPTAQYATAANGLRIVTARRPDAETVAITLAIRAGARFENEFTVAAAHFLEHMYLQGTPSRPNRDAVMRTVTARGGTLHVGTGWEFVDFAVLMAPEDFDVALDLLADLLGQSTFQPNRVEHQRGLIRQELAQRGDNPTIRAFDLFYGTLFRDHELRFLPSGLPQGVEQLDRESLLRYRAQRVVPANIVAGIVTPFEHADVVARVEATLGQLPAGAMPSVGGESPPRAAAQEVQFAAGQNQAMIIVGGPVPGLSHPDRYPLWLLQTIFGPGGGRLFYDIRDAHGLAYDTSMRLALTAEAGAIMAYAGTDPANVQEVISRLTEHFQRARDELVDEAELENAFGYLIGGTIVGLESGSAQAGQLAHNTSLNLPISTAELEANLRKVTREDIQKVAHQYLAPERLTTVVVAPGE